ncbi:hypothetical protein LZ32DRAFT_610778 [Colletotrichum eremochloae]|nr:hypothetical protein LZ32DRAFT_610778 [Colletotrichum eremochloae]
MSMLSLSLARSLSLSFCPCYRNSKRAVVSRTNRMHGNRPSYVTSAEGCGLGRRCKVKVNANESKIKITAHERDAEWAAGSTGVNGRTTGRLSCPLPSLH